MAAQARVSRGRGLSSCLPVQGGFTLLGIGDGHAEDCQPRPRLGSPNPQSNPQFHIALRSTIYVLQHHSRRLKVHLQPPSNPASHPSASATVAVLRPGVLPQTHQQAAVRRPRDSVQVAGHPVHGVG
eukprot:361247-Chlamydomonas_euryale.AAC.1